jgi:glycosyltransferase involved in cell wall biosynthesis
LNEQGYASEVIVVDDGSSDETAKVAEETFVDAGRRTNAHIMRVAPNRGKGYAVRIGLLAARAPIALFSDADLSTPITETPKLVAPIRSGEYDVVFGSRALDRTLIGVHQSRWREQGGRMVNLLVRMATRMPIWDTQCGFKAFRMDVCRPIVEAATIDRFGFDIELLYIAHLAGLRMREWPVRWDHNEGSKLSPMRDGMRMLQEVFEIRRQARQGVYNDAIKKIRELTQREDVHSPIITSGEATTPPSDVSPEFTSAARRI